MPTLTDSGTHPEYNSHLSSLHTNTQLKVKNNQLMGDRGHRPPVQKRVVKKS